MDVGKRKMLIDEIEHWRSSKLLPEHYCDFLLNLYLDDPSDRPNKVLGVSSEAILNSSWKKWLLTFGIFTLISLLTFNFNSFQPAMQIVISAIFIAVCYWLGSVRRSASPVLSHVSFGAGSAMLLFIGPYLMKQHGADHPAWMLGYAVLCSLVWMIVGLAARIPLFHFCGWAGILLVYGSLLHEKLAAPNWFMSQISWLPLSVVFGWFGWLLHHRNKSAGAVFFLIGFILWYTPEMHMLYASGASDSVMQISFLGKMIGSGIVLFALRKKWIEWVA